MENERNGNSLVHLLYFLNQLLFNIEIDIKHLLVKCKVPVSPSSLQIHLCLSNYIMYYTCLHACLSLDCALDSARSGAPYLAPNALMCLQGLFGTDNLKTVEGDTQHFKWLSPYLLLRWRIPLPYKFCPHHRLL